MNTFVFPSRRALALAVSTALLAAGLSGCGEPSAAETAQAAQATASAPPADPLRVVPAPALAQRLKEAQVVEAPVSEPLEVVARVGFNEQSLARIGAAVTGRITELHALPGQAVRAGEVLAQLHSTELAAAQLALLKANAQRELAAKAVERARLLLASDVIGSAEVQRRETELAVAEVEQRAAADALRVMGVAPQKAGAGGVINSTSAIVSTLNGVVVERRVNRGQVVQPAEGLFTVADLSTVWVVAQVPEAEAARVRVGQKVRVSVPANGLQPVAGELTWVADTVDPETRTVTVRTELRNPQRLLKPEMLASMAIEPLPVPRLVVPSAAVVREENGDHVFVRQGQSGTYRLTRVELGDEVNGVRVVRGGLRAGDTIVVEGGFHLNNERKRATLEG
jgi:cobalt-zinc-cadmium efflux system membrane fusion protein